MKLRSKIMLCFLTCLIFALIVLLCIVSSKTGELGARITNGMGCQLIESSAREVSSWFSERIGEMQVISEFYSSGFHNETESFQYLSGVNSRLASMHGAAQSFIFKVDCTGFGWADAQTALDLLDRPYFQTALTSGEQIVVSPPLALRTDAESSIEILSMLDNEEGYLVATIPTSQIEQLVSDLDILGATVWIMSADGTLIAEDSNHVHGSQACPRLYSLLSLSASIREKGNSGLTVFHAPDGHPGQLFFSVIPETPQWFLAAWLPDEVLSKEVAEVTGSILLAGACILVTACLLSICLSGSLTKPVRSLRQSMDAIEQGIPNARADIRGSDEISDLGRSYNAMLDRVQALLLQVQQEQKAKMQAELNLLQSQINPHFLYNTLDMLRYKALEHDAVEVAEITNALSGFFRLSLSRGKDFISLNNEVEHAYLYLYIQQQRYPEQISFDIWLEEGLEEYRVPKLLLQPLIENALMHGLKPHSYCGHINVNICRRGDSISFCIRDDGVGIDQEKLTVLERSFRTGDPCCGFGLYNVNQRLILTYGTDSILHIKSKPEKGTEITFCIPIQRREKEEHLD